jgi:hypothetical protein
MSDLTVGQMLTIWRKLTVGKELTVERIWGKPIPSKGRIIPLAETLPTPRA